MSIMYYLIIMDEKDFFKLLGKKIRYYRKQKGWNQLNFGLEIGIHPNELSNIECGRRNLTLKTVFKIASALDIEAKDLFDFKNTEL